MKTETAHKELLYMQLRNKSIDQNQYLKDSKPFADTINMVFDITKGSINDLESTLIVNVPPLPKVLLLTKYWTEITFH